MKEEVILIKRVPGTREQRMTVLLRMNKETLATLLLNSEDLLKKILRLLT